MPTAVRRRARVSTSSAASWLWLRRNAPAASGRCFLADSAALRPGLSMRQLAAYLGRRFVLAQPFIDTLPQQVVAGPGEILHFGDQRRPHPMYAGEDQRRSKAGAARRRHLERHL